MSEELTDLGLARVTDLGLTEALTDLGLTRVTDLGLTELLIWV